MKTIDSGLLPPQPPSSIVPDGEVEKNQQCRSGNDNLHNPEGAAPPSRPTGAIDTTVDAAHDKCLQERSSCAADIDGKLDGVPLSLKAPSQNAGQSKESRPAAAERNDLSLNFRNASINRSGDDGYQSANTATRQTFTELNTRHPPNVVRRENDYLISTDTANCVKKNSAVAEPRSICMILDYADAMSARAEYNNLLKTGRNKPEALNPTIVPLEQPPSNGTKRRGTRFGIARELAPNYFPDADDADYADGAFAGDFSNDVFITAGFDRENTSEAESHDLRPKKSHNKERTGDQDRNIGSTVEEAEWTQPGTGITGDGECAYYLAMVGGTGTSLLRAPNMAKQNALPAVKPWSKAECKRRCGADGFCDPSSALGCGGEHCGNPCFNL